MDREFDLRMLEIVVLFALVMIALGIGYEIGTAICIERMRDYLAVRSRYSVSPEETGETVAGE